MRLEVGGMGIAIGGGRSVELLRRLPGFAIFETGEGRVDVHIELDSHEVIPEGTLLHSFDIVDGQMVCRFCKLVDGRYVYRFGDMGALLCPAPGREGEEPYRISELRMPAVLRFAVWTAVSMAGLGFGCLPVHSSVVVCDGRAVMCLGESGTGKSTHTRLWLQHIEGTHLLNDDSPLLGRDADGWHVYGSPWSGKTPCFRRERWPLAALLRLEQRPENTIRRLGTIESFTALQPSCPPCMMKDELLQDALVDYVGRVISEVPVYKMGCLPDEAAARLSHNTIFGQ
ncbi:MAG: hypothetical protein IKC19_06235 [Bacteroidales bacterium]|nr:hypothetical protein [Bacteroidales bacterium]